MPPVAFWTKEFKDGYEQLVNEYVLELTQVKKLLKVFSPVVLVEYFKTQKYMTLRFLKLDEQKALIYDLFKEQIKYLATLSIPKQELEKVHDKPEYIQRKVIATEAAKNSRINKGL